MNGANGKLTVVVLISGDGTNLQSLIDGAAGGRPFRICGVISNRAGVRGLQRAADAGIPAEVVDHREFPDRADFDSALADAIEAYRPGLIVLAGFMRILTAAFVRRFSGRMINIHPSLLPAFQGLHTHRRVLEAGVDEHGASVHFVTEELDGGPVIAQVRVPVRPGDDEERLAARVLEREHELLSSVVSWIAEGLVLLRDDSVWYRGRPLREPIQCGA